MGDVSHIRRHHDACRRSGPTTVFWPHVVSYPADACTTWARGLLSVLWEPGCHVPATYGPDQRAQEKNEDHGLAEAGSHLAGLPEGSACDLRRPARLTLAEDEESKPMSPREGETSLAEPLFARETASGTPVTPSQTGA